MARRRESFTNSWAVRLPPVVAMLAQSMSPVTAFSAAMPRTSSRSRPAHPAASVSLPKTYMIHTRPERLGSSGPRSLVGATVASRFPGSRADPEEGDERVRARTIRGRLGGSDRLPPAPERPDRCSATGPPELGHRLPPPVEGRERPLPDIPPGAADRREDELP